MKRLVGLFILAMTMFSMTVVFAAHDVYVDGYNKKDGTHVDGYHRTSPDGDKTNNYDYPGNTNPYKQK